MARTDCSGSDPGWAQQIVFGSATAPGGAGTGTHMGIGALGDPQVLLKRKFRFLFGIQYCNSKKTVSPSFVKMAARPDITIEDTELNFLNETTWIPGKAKWETITVTYYDAANSTKLTGDNGLYSWLATVYDFTTTCRTMASKSADYAGTGTIILLDGCGNPLEKWTLGNMWPTSVKFGELAMDSSDVCEVELTLRYSNVTYTSYCGETISLCDCTTC